MHPDNKNYYWRIAGFYFFYYAFIGMFAPYWSLYLKSLHFCAIEIAILMSIQPVMRMISAHDVGVRSGGSVGFIVAVVGLGFAFDYIAIAWLLWAGLVCEIGMLIFSRQMPATAVLAHHTDRQPSRQIALHP